MYNSVGLSIFTMSYRYHHYLVQEFLHHPKMKLVSIKYLPSSPKNWANSMLHWSINGFLTALPTIQHRLLEGPRGPAKKIGLLDFNPRFNQNSNAFIHFSCWNQVLLSVRACIHLPPPCNIRLSLRTIWEGDSFSFFCFLVFLPLLLEKTFWESG